MQSKKLLYVFVVLFHTVSVYSVHNEIKEDVKIVTNYPVCTAIGKKLFDNGATVPEVFIAVSSCEGMVNPQDAGLGGGFQVVIYNSSCDDSIYINAREKSPMYWPEPRRRTDFYGGVGIPGVLKGYQYLYDMQFCNYTPTMKWENLFNDVIRLGHDGFNLSKTFLDVYNLIDEPYIFNIQNGIMRNRVLANTFKQISIDGPKSSMYQRTGKLYNLLMKTQPLNEILRDITLYNVSVNTPNICKITYPSQLKIYTSNVPGSGVCICVGMQILSKVYRSLGDKITKQQRFLIQQETLKYMYSIQPHIKSIPATQILSQTTHIAKKILTNLKKPPRIMNALKPKSFGKIKLNSFVIESPYGTTNVVVKRGNVTLVGTSTINYSFGSKHYLKNLGFFLNNQLYDFTYDIQNHPNAPKPNTHPQSSISTTIITDKTNHIILAIGGAGGEKIIGAVFQAIARRIYDKQTLYKSINGPRCLPKFKPSETRSLTACEPGVDGALLRGFRDRVFFDRENGYSAVTGIDEENAVFDSRRGGYGIVAEITNRRKREDIDNVDDEFDKEEEEKKNKYSGEVDVTKIFGQSFGKRPEKKHCMDNLSWQQCKNNTICSLLHRKMKSFGLVSWTYDYTHCNFRLMNINKFAKNGTIVRENIKYHTLLLRLVHEYILNDIVDISKTPTKIFGGTKKVFYCVSDYTKEACNDDKICSKIKYIVAKSKYITYEYNIEKCKLKVINIDDHDKLHITPMGQGKSYDIPRKLLYLTIVQNILK